jgi:hypothetical protein
MITVYSGTKYEEIQGKRMKEIMRKKKEKIGHLSFSCLVPTSCNFCCKTNCMELMCWESYTTENTKHNLAWRKHSLLTVITVQIITNDLYFTRKCTFLFFGQRHTSIITHVWTMTFKYKIIQCGNKEKSQGTIYPFLVKRACFRHRHSQT